MIRAEQAKFDAMATRIAFSDKKGWQKGTKMFDRMAAPERIRRPLELPVPATDAAAAWFEANDIPYKPANGPH